MSIAREGQSKMLILRVQATGDAVSRNPILFGTPLLYLNLYAFGSSYLPLEVVQSEEHQ